MVLRIAVCDPLPLFRRGVMTALTEAGFDSEEPDDLLAWARVEEPRAVLFTVVGHDDWALLARLCQARAEIVVLAVLDQPSIPSYVRALSAGAVAAVARHASADSVRAVFAAALRGDSLVPTNVVRALVERPTGDAAGPAEGGPADQEREWLRQLAHGSSVARLADRAGYSERMMFRLLRELYVKLGVANRTEALIRARDEGWI